MDLGTANTVIFRNDQKVLDEPSIVAIDNNTQKCIAIGQQAKLMHEHTNPGIKTIRPLRNGVIADFNAAEMMIKGFIKQVNNKKKSLFSPNLKIVVGIPSGSTQVEIRAVRDSCEHAGGRDVYLIYEPMAAALGIGLDVEAPKGNMVVDIGGGTVCSTLTSNTTCASSTTSGSERQPPRRSRSLSELSFPIWTRSRSLMWSTDLT